MKLTSKILKEKTQEEINSFDDNYKRLNCKLTPLNESDESYLMVEKYIRATYKTNKIIQVFKINRQGEDKRFNKKIGNI